LILCAAAAAAVVVVAAAAAAAAASTYNAAADRRMNPMTTLFSLDPISLNYNRFSVSETSPGNNNTACVITIATSSADTEAAEGGSGSNSAVDGLERAQALQVNACATRDQNVNVNR
jgi:hypothetical protein